MGGLDLHLAPSAFGHKGGQISAKAQRNAMPEISCIASAEMRSELLTTYLGTIACFGLISKRLLDQANKRPLGFGEDRLPLTRGTQCVTGNSEPLRRSQDMCVCVCVGLELHSLG